MFVPDARLTATATKTPIWIPVVGNQVLVAAQADADSGADFARGDDPGFAFEGEPLLIGVLDDQPVWALDLGQPGEVDFGDSLESADLRGLFGKLSDELWPIAGRAVQLVEFARTSAFCGRCGAATADHHRDRAKQCPDCKLMMFPRLAPAVIMLVERPVEGSTNPDETEVLLAWGRQFPGRFYSALAGFVEPGESLEETVHREVREEVGIEVTDVRYFGSQPWPFPHSLMLGFRATYVSGDIKIQEEEIVEADWYRADDLPPVPRGRMSIAGWLIDDWLERVGG